MQGWALAMQEDVDVGIALIRQGFTMTEGVGLKLYRPYFLALLAEAYCQMGQPEAGLSVLDEALTLVEATEERWLVGSGGVASRGSASSASTPGYPSGDNVSASPWPAASRPRRWSCAPR